MIYKGFQIWRDHVIVAPRSVWRANRFGVTLSADTKTRLQNVIDYWWWDKRAYELRMRGESDGETL